MRFKRHGFFKTRWHKKSILRYQCYYCKTTFSERTFHPTYRQKRPDLNTTVFAFYCSTVTQRRLALLLRIDRKTISRKFLFMAAQASLQHEDYLRSLQGKVPQIQFDEMESFEHSRLKPLSVALAVNPDTHHILAVDVACFAAKGKMATIAFQKYGLRPDNRKEARTTVLSQLQPLSPEVITTDGHPAYPSLVKNLIPNATHKRVPRVKYGRQLFHKNRRRNKNDKLFSLNHVAAKIRNDLSRMLRKVWTTTKQAKYLKAHLQLYIAFQNRYEFNF